MAKKLNIIDFDYGVRSEEIQENFEILQDEIKINKREDKFLSLIISLPKKRKVVTFLLNGDRWITSNVHGDIIHTQRLTPFESHGVKQGSIFI